MSAGSYNYLRYAYFNASTNLATFTTEDNLQKTYPLVKLPLPAILPNVQEGTSKSFKVKARGLLGTTSAPTFTWSLRLLTSTTWSAGGILLASSAALTAGTTQTLAPWELEFDFGIRTLSVGAASTVVGMGQVESPLGLASPGFGSLPPNNTTPVVATLDDSLTYNLFLSAACSVSNAANLINLQMLKVYEEN